MSKAADILEIEATITSRGQTTVPAAIRRMLRLADRDQVVFRGLRDGTVVIAKKEVEATASDPAIGAFLAFLERDIMNTPQGVQPISHELLGRGRALVDGVDVDLDAPLPDDA